MNHKSPESSCCCGCQNPHTIPPLEQEARAYFLSKGISSFELHMGASTEWRVRAKLAVQGSASHPIIGLYQENTHIALDASHCKAHHPAINRAIEYVRSWVKASDVRPYDELTRQGLIRYLQFVVERATGRLQLTLVLNTRQDQWDQKIDLQKDLKTLWESHPDFWHSIWINFNPGKDNVIFSPRWQHVAGEPWLKEVICGRTIVFHPASFAQANLDMFEQLLEKVKTYVESNDNLLEYYAGVGAIGLVLADKCRSVKCIEIVPTAKECFQESLKGLSENFEKRLSFMASSSEAALDLLKQHPSVVIVDPPRKGLSPQMLDALKKESSNFRLIYISCGWESFKRDCDALLASGWQLEAAQSYLFFPGTNHIEVLAVFKQIRLSNLGQTY